MRHYVFSRRACRLKSHLPVAVAINTIIQRKLDSKMRGNAVRSFIKMTLKARHSIVSTYQWRGTMKTTVRVQRVKN